MQKHAANKSYGARPLSAALGWKLTGVARRDEVK